MERTQPLSIAHRGSHDRHPENSLPAILRALELGAQGVEIDVHATADSVLVVHHDPDLKDGRLIASLPAKVVLGTELVPGICIPSLDEVLEAVAGRAIVFIETKAGGVEFHLIRAVRMSSAETAVHSFDHPTIANIKRTMPALRAGILTTGSAENALRDLAETGADDLWHSAADVTPLLIAGCRRAGKQVIAWTANSRAECHRLAEIGVDGICTDDLGVLSAVSR